MRSGPSSSSRMISFATAACFAAILLGEPPSARATTSSTCRASVACASAGSVVLVTRVQGRNGGDAPSGWR